LLVIDAEFFREVIREAMQEERAGMAEVRGRRTHRRGDFERVSFAPAVSRKFLRVARPVKNDLSEREGREQVVNNFLRRNAIQDTPLDSVPPD
jgi:hypothetical protein